MIAPALLVAVCLAADPAPKSAASVILPITGQPVPELAAFDAAILTWLDETQFTAAAVAVQRNGKILFQRGYGWMDQARKKPTQPDTPMRLASVCKPITAAAIRNLIAAGKIKDDTPVFDYLKIEPAASGGKATLDPRLKTITIKNLMEHKGGWDRDKSFDPMFADNRIQPALHLKGPAAALDIIRYMWSQPLDFDPGERRAYSNFGYCILGRVVEKASGKPYIKYIQEDLAKPLGMTSLILSRSLAKDRPPNEVYYPVPDDLHMERMDSHGGMTCNAPDLCRFMAQYWIIPGQKRPPGARNYTWTHFGSLPGTTTVIHQRLDGVDFAVLVNNRRQSREKDGDKLLKAMNAAADSIKKWPAH